MAIAVSGVVHEDEVRADLVEHPVGCKRKVAVRLFTERRDDFTPGPATP